MNVKKEKTGLCLWMSEEETGNSDGCDHKSKYANTGCMTDV